MANSSIEHQDQSHSSKASKKEEDENGSNYTTVMLRNIPNRITKWMLIEHLYTSGFRGDIDYMYLPIDFKEYCSKGYCFVNFRNADARIRFVQSFHCKPARSCLPLCNSDKVCEVTRAKWQGKEQNMQGLKKCAELMAQMADHPEWRPLLFNSNGETDIKETYEFFQSDDCVSAARSPAAWRRQMRNQNQGGGFWYPTLIWFPSVGPSEYSGREAMGRRKGYGRGKKGRGDSMASYAGGYAGMAGFQYPPDERSYDWGCFMPYEQPMGSYPQDKFADGEGVSSEGWWRAGNFADGVTW